MLLCQQAAAPLIVVMSPWISRTFLEAQKYPLAYIAQANKSSHFIFRVPPLTVPDKCLLTQHQMQQKASGVGVSLMRNGKILATGENVSLGTVNKSKVPLGLSATYGQTGNKVSAGTVQSVIGVTFIYE